MITLADIRKAITTALKSKFQNIKVFFDDVENSTDDYFYIEFTPKSKTIDEIEKEEKEITEEVRRQIEEEKRLKNNKQMTSK